MPLGTRSKTDEILAFVLVEGDKRQSKYVKCVMSDGGKCGGEIESREGGKEMPRSDII